MYFYVRAITGHAATRLRAILWHCGPAALVLALQIAFVLTGSANATVAAFETWFGNLKLIGLYVQIIVYIHASCQVLRQNERWIRDQHSSVDGLTLSWLGVLVGLFAVLIVIDMSVTVPSVIRDERIPFLPVLMLAEALAIFAIGYFSQRHSSRLSAAQTKVQTAKYGSSPIDQPLSSELAKTLIATMRARKPHLKNDLTLPDLAEMTGLSSHHLSQVINGRFETNFYGFINRHRVVEAQSLLRSNPEASITTIAFDSGFNNRASFNNAFRKYVGLTPSAYRKIPSADDALFAGLQPHRQGGSQSL